MAGLVIFKAFKLSLFVFVLCLPHLGWAYQIDLFEDVLTTYVNQHGRVDYSGLKADSGKLDVFVQSLAKTGPSSNPSLFQDSESRLAFWLNAYNALVLYGIKNAYPVDSVTDILPDFGFFKAKTFEVDGQFYTLDAIEHDIIRPQFKDPRIHAALNCGAMSCPKLSARPFYSAELDQQLALAMQNMVRSPEHVRLDFETKTLYLSSIFNWFGSDFITFVADQQKRGQPKIVDYIAHFHTDRAREKLQSVTNLSIVYMDYDWALNKQADPDR